MDDAADVSAEKLGLRGSGSEAGVGGENGGSGGGGMASGRVLWRSAARRSGVGGVALGAELLSDFAVGDFGLCGSGVAYGGGGKTRRRRDRRKGRPLQRRTVCTNRAPSRAISEPLF